MIQVGTTNWLQTLKAITEPLGSNFWSSFTPATESELRNAEKQLDRGLDGEFREFYRTIWYGAFPIYGGFAAPQEFIHGVDSAIYFITGSLSPGSEGAKEEERLKLWLTRGAANPNPENRSGRHRRS
ncbi:MAG: SMI1/KNR4 family protein [Planctomycetaceae bacterium]|nr:MAG: SMI1/KNR4 family protein [Planctomycetaceae bacterium]